MNSIKIITLCVITGLLSVVIYSKIATEKDHFSVCDSKYPYIRNSLNCEEDPTLKTKEIKSKVESYVNSTIKKGQVKNVSVFYRDLDSRQWFGVEENLVFAPASLLKLPLAIAIYKAAELDRTVLAEKRKFISSSEADLFRIQNIQSLEKIVENKEYTIEELIQYMIENSDNNAMNILIGSTNTDFLNKVYVDLGIKLPTLKGDTEDFVSTKVYGSIMRALFNASYLNQESSNHLLETMVKSTYKQGIVAGVPADVKVANKFGERAFYDLTNKNIKEIELHDCGIVYEPKFPYILCVMTKGSDYEAQTSVISEVSRIIYEER